MCARHPVFTRYLNENYLIKTVSAIENVAAIVDNNGFLSSKIACNVFQEYM